MYKLGNSVGLNIKTKSVTELLEEEIILLLILDLKQIEIQQWVKDMEQHFEVLNDKANFSM